MIEQTPPTNPVQCPSCGALALDLITGKCEKCKYTAALDAYGYKVHKVKNKTYVLTRKDEDEPLSSFPSLTSMVSKKTVVSITKAPLVVVEKAFARLAVQPAKQEKKDTQDTAEKESFSEETTIKAWELLRDPSFFYQLGNIFERGFMVPKVNKPRFVLGEERNKRLLGPLLIGATKLGMTSIVRAIGESGTAKDTMVRMWLKLLNIKYLERSYLTAAAIRYSQNIQDADLLYIPDTPRMQGETGRTMLFMRSDDGGLISEYAMKDKDTGEMATKTVTLPIKGVVTTSTEVIVGAALASGMWTLTTNADLELTKKVKDEKLKLRAGKRKLLPDSDLEVWRCAFEIMLTEETPESGNAIEYAEELNELIPSERSESRRDPDKLCDLISLVAWMRRFQKSEEAQGKPDFADLYIALQIGKDAIAETMSPLSEKEQAIFGSLSKCQDQKAVGATVRDISEDTKIPYKTVYRILEDSLLEKGFATVEKEGKRNYYRCLTGKNDNSFPFNEGRNKISSDDVIAFVSGVIRNFSLSHGNMKEKISVVDPITGERVTIEQDGSFKVEPKVENSLSLNGEKVRSSKSGINLAPNGESGRKSFLPDEKGKEKAVFLVKKVKPAEPCEQCGSLAVEHEITKPTGEKLRKCPSCFEKFKQERANVEWREEDWPA
jgi:predicted transcriptional regulator